MLFFYLLYSTQVQLLKTYCGLTMHPTLFNVQAHRQMDQEMLNKTEGIVLKKNCLLK